MNLSKSQQQLFWSKWSEAVKAQGWRAAPKRSNSLSLGRGQGEGLPSSSTSLSAGGEGQGEVVRSSSSPMNAAEIEQQRHLLLERAGFSSLTEVDPLAGFDRVLAELAALINPNDLSAQLRQANQPAIRAQYTIDQLKTKIAAVSPGNNYLRVVMRDKFGTTNWDDLSLDQFIQLYATLRNRRKSSRRRREETQTSVPLSPACLPHCDNDPY